jgi:predicted dehydrogenase
MLACKRNIMTRLIVGERMTQVPVGVGIIGANPERGWAARAHVPAIQAGGEFRLVAVATTRAESAALARERFGADHAFTDAASLAGHPDVELVVVAVKVPAHVELVSAALRAGKHVWCEWPLTRTAAEAEALSAAAETAGVHHVAGLQARFSPAVAKARAMLTGGRLGTVLSANLYSARAKGNTREVPAWTAYTYDANDRAGLIEVLGGHALDLIQFLVGPVRQLAARTVIRSPAHVVTETGAAIRVTAADHLLATVELDSGAVVSIHLHDAEAAIPRTRLEIMGTQGDLALVSAAETDPWVAQLQVGELNLYHAHPGQPAWQLVPLDDHHFDHLPTDARNVGRLYHQLAADLRDETRHAPDFTAAHRLHQLIELARPSTAASALPSPSATSWLAQNPIIE